jgi:hypothetical protein
MEVESILSREEVILQTKKEDERSDLKQHADKMLRDFERFNDHSSNRAIWELVQNACDLTSECEVVIDYRDDKIAFTHNGKPFDTKSLISLIKQVSGKYGDQEDIPEVGKYGTGFLTTHSFGRKFIINSVLDAGGNFLPIKDFEVDRSPKTWELLSDNIGIQKKRVFEILSNEEAVEVLNQTTTFTYLPETDKEFEYIENSLFDLNDYIPLVFTINERLKSVRIIEKSGTITDYRLLKKDRQENNEGINLYKTTISKNNEEVHVFSIIDEEDELEIILPISEDGEVFEFNNRIARLFLYYPLIGSESFGLNFIINCKNFLPTEPRDGVHLNSDKDQVKEQEEQNRKIIARATEIIFEFLNSNIIKVSNPLLYMNVCFKINSDNHLLNEYYGTLQAEWNLRLKPLPFVETLNGFKSVEDATYFSQDFLTDDTMLFDTFYELIAKFYHTIPTKETVKKWSEFAKNWNDESIEFIGIHDLISKITECNLESFNVNVLIRFYQYLIDSGNSGMFTDFNLIPNIHGALHKLGYLLLPVDLDEHLIELGKTLIPDSIDKLIHPDFRFSFPLTYFNRRNFSDDVKNNLDSKNLDESIYLPADFDIEPFHRDLIDRSQKIESNYYVALLDFCKVISNIDSKSKPNKMLKKITDYYSMIEDFYVLPNVKEIGDNIEYRSIRKIVVKIFFNLLAMHNEEGLKIIYSSFMMFAVCMMTAIKTHLEKVLYIQTKYLNCIEQRTLNVI